MFRGTSYLSLDAKGRMSVPAKHRDRLRELCSGQLVITVDCDRCLLIYPLPEWEEVEKKLVKLSSTNPVAKNLKRLLMGHAEDCEIDASGRILLSGPLRKFAGLSKKVVLVGQGNKFELWDEEAWECVTDESLDRHIDLPGELESFSF